MEKLQDTIVISGISGSFPSSENVDELQNNLFNKINMTKKLPKEWQTALPDVPIRMGEINDKDKFDAGFFGVSSNVCNTMDPMGRMLLEKTYEAILDSGTNPIELRGTKTGVFVCLLHSDTEHYWTNELKNFNSGLKNSLRSMLAKRIAYHFEFTGPTFTVDSACSSSIYCINHAVELIKNNVIDNAIIGGCNFILNPIVTLQFTGLGALSADAMCRPFDENGNGYVRGESVVCILLQKSKIARRIYAEVIHVKTNCDGFKDQSITFPSQEGQTELLRDIYSAVDPNDVVYVEAHGTGTKAGDPVELNSLDNVLCKNRKYPLLIGSMKANTGHAEPASGLNSLIKVICAMENGSIPPTINHKNIRNCISGLVDGRLRVVNEVTAWPNNVSIVGVNSFGFGGANGHLVVKSNTKIKSKNIKVIDMPLFVCASARTKEGLELLLKKSQENANDLEYVSLLHSIYRFPTPNNHYRGFLILNDDAVKKSITNLENKRPICIVFGRPNKNWSNSNNDLLKLKIFKDFIDRAQTVCETLNLPIDPINLIQNPEDANNYHIMRAILIQIGLYQALISLNIEIDLNCIQGCSFGQITVAYIKNELTLDEMILTAFYASAITDDNYNILTNNNNVSLIEVLPNPIRGKLNKWLLSMQSYLLVDSLQEDTIVLEIGEEISIDHDKKFHMSFCRENNVISFIESLGKLYEYGYDIDLLKLYPDVKFPVSRGTPMISSHIKWKHDKEWHVMRYEAESDCEYFHRLVTINLCDKEWEYLNGHVIDGRILLPASAYIVIAWDTLGVMKGRPKLNMEYVTIKNPKFLRALPLHEDKPTELTILIQKSKGLYMIKEDGNVVATGEIHETEHSELLEDFQPLEVIKSEHFALNKKDVYKEFIIRNYNYEGEFKSIVSCNNEVTSAIFEWKKNFITFLDAMFQLPLLQVDTRKLRVPVGVDCINLDVRKQMALTENTVPVEYHPQSGILRCKYVEFRGSNANTISKRKQQSQPVIKSYQFIPNDYELNRTFALNVILQLIIENTTGLKLKIIEIIDDNGLFYEMSDILKNEPLVQAEIKLLLNKPLQLPNNYIKIQTLIGENDCQLICANNLSENDQLLEQVLQAIHTNGFILSRERLTTSCIYPKLKVISVIKTDREKFILLRKNQSEKSKIFINISNSLDNFNWLIRLQENLNKENKIVLYSQGDPFNGILGLVNCLKREMGTENLQCIFIYDEDKKNTNFFNAQLNQGLLFNIWKCNQWGTYRYLPIDEHQLIECDYRYISITKPGDISSAKWLQGTEISETDKINIVHVHFAAINNKDIMISKGLLPTDLIKGNTEHSYNPGFEFSGIDTNNNRVMGLVKHSALSNVVISNQKTLWTVPEQWSLEDAATIPLVYCTVLYALIVVAKIKKGQTILIHSGTGGIGQAAINISLFCGLKVFTTVGSDKKRDYIRKEYPKISDNHIGYSRDSTFEQVVLKETNGIGVDVVLNSQGEENFHASMCCLAKRGHFVEIGRQNMDKDNKLSEEIFLKGGTFHGIDIEKCLNNDKSITTVSDLLKGAIDNGLVKPLKRQIYDEEQIDEAFNFMSTGEHVGKILIRINQTENKLKCQRRYSCNPNGSYVLIGGLGGFGMELSNWLITRGCKKLVLTSRVGVSNGYQDMRIRCWKANGVDVSILTADVTTYNGCKEILERAKNMGPVISIFNLAVVLKDALVENQTAENYQISFAPKAMATMRLDALSRALCPKLKDFVIFSSVVSGWGNTGQSNYGMANSVMERICEQRRKDDLPGLAIQWGAIGNVGILMEKEDAPKIVGGTALQSITSCLKVLDRVLRREEIVLSSMIVADKTDTNEEQITVKESVAKILGIRNTKTVGNTLTLPQLGLDSVMVVEVKEKLERNFGVHLTIQEIRKLTFEDLDKFQDLK